MATSRRVQNSSEESGDSVSSSLRADIQLTNRLSALLDQQRSETVERALSISRVSSPENILVRVLSPQSYISTTSSFARYQQSQQLLATTGYRPIGFGQCGLVFERPGRNYVLKIARPSYEDTLWADFVAHFNVRQAFEQQRPECRVPQVFSYVTKDNQEWWDNNLPLLTEVHSSMPLPAMALITERILPLPKVAREALINKYCPAAYRPAVAANATNRDCLARVYLGRRRFVNEPSPPNFTLRNYNLFLDQMIDLDLPVKAMATDMGEALATIHWAARVDGYDVEFVLGSEGDAEYTRDVSLALHLTPKQVAAMSPHTDIESLMKVNFQHRTTRLWVLDFNLCNTWEEEVGWEHPEPLISQLVIAFFENDPYYPLPLMEDDLDKELWEAFSTAYLGQARQILETPEKDRRLAGLPQMFIDGCILREQENLANNLGHGCRDHKK